MRKPNNSATIENTSRDRAICVLGMHRSGTSAIARAVNLLGVYLGELERLIPPNKDINSKGYWEHRVINDIHERILSTLSRTWHDIWPMPNGWWAYPEIQPFREELLSTLRREFGDKTIWGWKDPRTCLMLPLWHEILQELDVELSYVIVVRNPLDVATSLWKRDNLALNESFLLWQLHMLSALMGTKGSKRAIIQYDRFLENWHASIERIATTLEVPWPTDDSLLNNEIEAFLDPGLRHSQSTLSTLESNVEIPESIVNAYRLCLDAEMHINFLNSKEFSDKIDKLYLEYTAYTRMISSDLKEALREKNKQIQQKNEQIRRKNEQISAILNTWSWMVTAPLRWLGRLLSRI